MKLLASGAHPDDLEIYMFGTLAAACANGDEVQLVVVTDGAGGGTAPPEYMRTQRRAEAITAAAGLGVEPLFLDYPDGALVADADLIAELKLLIRQSEADLVLTHAPNDYHADHRALSDAIRIASNFAAPVIWADTMMGTGFVPTHLVDITAHFDAKCAAIRAHGSQDPERFVAMAERLNGFRSSQANAPNGYAEAWRFEPSYPFADIRGLLPPAPPVRPIADRRKS